MNRKRWIVEISVWLLMLAAFWLSGALFLRPPEGAAQTTRAPEDRWTSLQAAASEIRGALRSQPDVESAEVFLMTPEDRRFLALVSVTWATPTPPPPKRLETIALWAYERLGGACEVHVVTPDDRYLLGRRDP